MPTTVRSGDILFNNGTTQSTAATGTVSSVATGNGLSGGTITTSGTLVVACPTFNTVGSYCLARITGNPSQTLLVSPGSNYSAGGGQSQVQSAAIVFNSDGSVGQSIQNNLSGTWKWMGPSTYLSEAYQYVRDVTSVVCRVS